MAGGGPLDAGERALVAAARAGDGEAFSALVRPHIDALLAFARRAGADPASAPDVAQETLLRAWRHIEGFRGACAFRTWLLAIAWRVARTEGERAGRRPQPREDLPDLAADEPGPEERSVTADLAARAHSALSRLAPGERAAITRVDVGGQPLADAAKALGIPLGTLKTHLHRGRRRLRALLEGNPRTEEEARR